jgi:hypothetical protein
MFHAQCILYKFKCHILLKVLMPYHRTSPPPYIIYFEPYNEQFLTPLTFDNKMERMNGEIRDREKTMRGLKKVDTPILKDYPIYQNYIREHEALEGKHPLKTARL